MSIWLKAMAKALEGPSQYAWIIDTDHLADVDGQDDAGTTGPSDAPSELLDILENDETQGTPFRILDDDGELYYQGRYLGLTEEYSADSEWGFKPLVDFGEGAGATEIQYKNSKGSWEAL